MHALRDYGSDSEHSEDSTSATDGNERGDSSKKLTSNETEDSSKNVTVDFFGMLSGGSTSRILSKGEKQHKLSDGKKVLDIKVEGGEKITAEIPSSSFWNDVQSEELRVLDQTSNYDGRNVEHPSMLYRKQTGKMDGSSQQKRTCDYNSSQSYNKRQITNVQSKTAVNEQRETIETCKTVEKRKMFIVHPRILPMIHGKRKKCTTPGNKEWDNPGHAGAINRLKWNVPNYSHLLVTASMDSSIKIWNVWSQLDPCVQVLSAHTKAVRDVDWNKDGKQLLSCGYDKTARIWDIETGKTEFIFTIIIYNVDDTKG